MGRRERHERFEEQIAAHRRLLLKVGHLYARTPDDRDDLVQEIALQLWRAFPRFDARLRFSTWMYRVALNVAISWSRAEGVRARHVEAADDRVLDIPAPEPSEDARRLEEAVRALAPLDRALVVLHLEGHTHAEIAEVLGLGASNVGTRLSRLVATMKKKEEER